MTTGRRPRADPLPPVAEVLGEDPSAYDAGFVDEHLPGRPSEIYLDTASVGLVPASVLDAQRRGLRALERGVLGSRGWHETTDRLPGLLAQELGVAPTSISVMTSTGEALNAVVRALRLTPDAEVLTFVDDFPTVHLPFAGAGLSLRRISPVPGEDRTTTLLRELTPRTAVVSVSQVVSTTGEALDLPRLGAATRAAGTLLVVDGAQAFGAVPADLSLVDVYLATAYKWQLAGFGQCVVVVDPALADRLEPGLLGHGNVPPSRGLVYGHENLAGSLALVAASELRAAYGHRRVHARTRHLTDRLRSALAATGLDVVQVGEAGSPVVSVRGLDADRAVADLRAAGCVTASRAGFVRLSPYFYTQDSDVDQAAELLGRLARPARPGTVRHP